MPLYTKKAFFDDYIFNISDDVYEPAEDTFLFAENLKINEGVQVLDMGTGCGILGVLAAKKANAILSVDINPYAINCAKKNAAINCVQEKMTFLQCDLFSSISRRTKFDVILFNAPYLPSENKETAFWLGRAWSGGKTGRELINRFIWQAPSHLKKTGKLLLMQSTLSNLEQTQQAFKDCHLKTTIVAELALPFFETLVLVEATFQSNK